MLDFFKKLFQPQTSGATAKERLRLVLLSDHLSLAPEVVEALRGDLIAVISKYVEVDEANCDVTFEQQDSAVAMLANIPILALRSRPMPPSDPRPPAPAEPPPGDPAAAVPVAAGAAEAVEEAPLNAAVPLPKRRRRRRRAGVAPMSASG